MKIQGNHMEIIMEIMQSYDDFEIGNQLEIL